MVMSVEEFTECFSKALVAADVAAISTLDARLRDVVQREIENIDGDLNQQHQLADKLTRLNELYKRASEQLQQRRNEVQGQRESLRVAKTYQAQMSVG